MALLADLDLGDPKVPLPEKIGRFRIAGRLGRGGMGVVLDAQAPDGRLVALKLIRPQTDSDRQKTLNARLLREARILERIHHPGIVGLVESGEVDGVAYLAMERVEGVTLHAIRKKAPLDKEALVTLALQLTEALGHLHEAGVVHRDVKPGNVLVRADGRVVLADFGIARHQEATGITRVGEVVGSAGFLAPECFQGKLPNEKSDQYSLGVLLFEMAAIKRRIRVPKNAPLVERFIKLRELDWSRFPSDPSMHGLKKILERMLAGRPEDRFTSMRTCLRALGELGQEGDARPRNKKPESGLGVAALPAEGMIGEGTKLSKLAAGLPVSSVWGPDAEEREDDEDVAKALFDRVSPTVPKASELTEVTAADRVKLPEPLTLHAVARPPSGSAQQTVFSPKRGSSMLPFSDENTQGESDGGGPRETTEPEAQAYVPQESTERGPAVKASVRSWSGELTPKPNDSPAPIESLAQLDPNDAQMTELEGGIERDLVDRVSKALNASPADSLDRPLDPIRELRVPARVVKESRSTLDVKVADPALKPSNVLVERTVPMAETAARRKFLLPFSVGLLGGLALALLFIHAPKPAPAAFPVWPLRDGPISVALASSPDASQATLSLEKAQRAFARGDFAGARADLLDCLRVGDLPECHYWYGALLSLSGEPGSRAHVARASHK
ncbi:MAG: serine/threonine protein kinase [Deltaproteobacteria bacterium]|nr:serine/threonine protein kinase [Deltaproteobacteria bacterium]